MQNQQDNASHTDQFESAEVDSAQVIGIHSISSDAVPLEPIIESKNNSIGQAQSNQLDASSKNGIAAFAANLGINFNSYQVNFDTRGLNKSPIDNEEQSQIASNCLQVKVPSAPNGTIQKDFQTMANNFLNKSKNEQFILSQQQFNNKNFRNQSDNNQSSQIQNFASKQIQERNSFQIVAQRELRLQGFEPKSNIQPTQKIYDMIEPRAKYHIDEEQAQSLEELDEKTKGTKLANALKEVPLQKPSQPSIRDLFFQNKNSKINQLGDLNMIQGEEELSKELEEIEQMPITLPFQRSDAKTFTFQQDESNKSQPIKMSKHSSTQDSDGQECAQTTETRSSQSNSEKKFSSFGTNNLRSFLGTGMQMINMDEDVDDLENELMDEINIVSLESTKMPFSMKRTKSNSIYKQQNLEEEKSEEEHFANTQKIHHQISQNPLFAPKDNLYSPEPLFRQIDGQIQNNTEVKKESQRLTFNQLFAPKDNIETIDEKIHDFDKTFKNENQEGNSQFLMDKSLIKVDQIDKQNSFIEVEVKQRDQELESETKKESQRNSYFSNNTNAQTELTSDTRSQNKTVADSQKLWGNQSILGSENSKNIDDFIFRLSQMNGIQNEKNDEKNSGDSSPEIRTSEERLEQFENNSINESMNRSIVEQDQNINEFETPSRQTESVSLHADQNQSQQQINQNDMIESNIEEISQSNIDPQVDIQSANQTSTQPIDNNHSSPQNNLPNLQSLFAAVDRRRHGSFRGQNAQRSSFGSLNEEVNIISPEDPFASSREPNIEEPQTASQNDVENIQRNISMSSSDMLEINMNEAIPQPLRRQNAVIFDRDSNQVNRFENLNSQQIQAVQEERLREAFSGIQNEQIDIEELQMNLPTLTRQPGIRIDRRQQLSINQDNQIRVGQERENQLNQNRNSSINQFQRAQTLTQIFFSSNSTEIQENDNQFGNDQQNRQQQNRNPLFGGLNNGIQQLTFQRFGQLNTNTLNPRGQTNSGINSQIMGPSLSGNNRRRTMLPQYDPSINYRQLRESQNSSLNQSINQNQSQNRDNVSSDSEQEQVTDFSEPLFKKGNIVSKEALKVQDFKQRADFNKGHPKWIQEIDDYLNPLMMEKLNEISTNLGMLSILIFIRLQNIFQMSRVISLKVNSSEMIEAQIQNSFNEKESVEGIPYSTKKFLIFIAKRITNIMHYNNKKTKLMYQQLALDFSRKSGSNEFMLRRMIEDDSSEVNSQSSYLSAWSADLSAGDPNTEQLPLSDMSFEILSTLNVVDKVFPSIDEIHYCIKKGLVQKRELIVYKMILDMNEALTKNVVFNQPRSLTNTDGTEKYKKELIPCCLKFYKSMNQEQMTELVTIMKEINSQIKSSFENFNNKDSQLSNNHGQKNDLMFFKAEQNDLVKSLKGNPVKILLNNFPLKLDQDQYLSSSAEKELNDDSGSINEITKYYRDMNVLLRQRIKPELSLKIKNHSFEKDKLVQIELDQTEKCDVTESNNQCCLLHSKTQTEKQNDDVRKWDLQFQKWANKTPKNDIKIQFNAAKNVKDENLSVQMISCQDDKTTMASSNIIKKHQGHSDKKKRTKGKKNLKMSDQKKMQRWYNTFDSIIL